MNKRIIKTVTDIMMTIGLFMLMAYPLTGNALHMWIGISEFILFAVHNVLNYKRYRSIFKGKYTPVRIMYIITDVLTILSAIALFISAVILSDCFGLIIIRSGKAFGRVLHLLSAYWGFMFMSLHIGLHWNTVCSAAGRRIKTNTVYTLILRTASILIAVFGAYVFIKNDILSYMFLKKQFVNFNLLHGKAVFFAEHIAMSGLWIFISHYLSKIVKEKYRK